jgi:hypothetical protein
MYIDDGMLACMKCGNRSLPPGVQPYKKRNIWERGNEEMKAAAVCDNCGRVKKLSGHDLCGGCYSSVRKYSWGTPECTAALAEAKKRFSSPNYKRGGGPRKKMSTEHIKKVKIHVQALSIKHNGGDPEMAGVIAALQIERDVLLVKADKLKQAIELLS